MRVAGRDRSRTRAVATLLHGNEPSGCRAVHGWLRSGAVPATDVLFWIAAVETALWPPGFAHRALPGRPDLNRSFADGPPGPERALARGVSSRLRDAAPECLVDLHNNSGHSPTYAVALRAGPAEHALAAFFGDTFIHYDLSLGSLVEVTCDAFPSVVIESGRSGDPLADAAARAGLDALLAAETVLSHADEFRLRTYRNPARVRVRPDVEFAFGDSPREGVPLTVSADVDRHNFELLAHGQAIGWLAPGAPWPFEAVRGSGAEVSREYFRLRGGRIEVARPLVPIMMTTDPSIARSDCLFYVVDPAPPRARTAAPAVTRSPA